ncbi:hypothetical protein C8A03DRAFT_15892 [Achaetomium macrosporum]|uniref:DNA replication regulator SLD2 n=1 Tax=Achaetomium macrosporum TaxID=79813 RepID=A0AAN7CA11_9PEZI|nr:hypothetical protein C8A03DRAFT_15892 [Achaetomium macrosporum]
MDDRTKAAYENESLRLRAELKQWERDWATAHGGKKPGRDDIKRNPDIAQKYKQYNKVRDILAGRVPLPLSDVAEATNGRQQRKRTRPEAAPIPPQTPSKRPKTAQTPRKPQPSRPEPMPYGAQTPSAATAMLTQALDRTVLTPVAAVPTSISPTPQKDGRVLGLFDLLGRTPSRSTAADNTLASPVVGAVISVPTVTPSKQRTTNDILPQAITTTAFAMTPTTARFASTPTSKRTTQLFQTRTTALQERHDKGNATTPFKTPSSKRISKPRSTPTSSTPSFLRRRNTVSSVTALSGVAEQDEGNDDDESWKKIGPLRLPRKLGLARSLSSVVAGLRKMEEEVFEDEEEALREMEAEGSTATVVRKDVAEGGVRQVKELKDKKEPAEGQGAGREEEPVGLLSGFDDEALYDSAGEERQNNQQHQQPLRQFKKRGQKRTTRLVNMRPTRAKRPPAQNHNQEEEKEDDEIVPETQRHASNPTPAAEGGDDLRLSDAAASEAEFDGSESEDDEEEEKEQAKKTTQNKPKAPAAETGKEKSEGVVKRAVRKVKATAHANFKRLKLRNSGVKGGPGQNSRWRRRR